MNPEDPRHVQHLFALTTLPAFFECFVVGDSALGRGIECVLAVGTRNADGQVARLVQRSPNTPDPH